MQFKNVYVNYVIICVIFIVITMTTGFVDEPRNTF